MIKNSITYNGYIIAYSSYSHAERLPRRRRHVLLSLQLLAYSTQRPLGGVLSEVPGGVLHCLLICCMGRVVQAQLVVVEVGHCHVLLDPSL